jgi:acyl carrier protein
MNMTEKEFIDLIDGVCGVMCGTVTRNDSLGNNILFDSVALLGLIAMLDKKFGVNFNMEELSKINTIGDLFNRVTKQLQA